MGDPELIKILLDIRYLDGICYINLYNVITKINELKYVEGVLPTVLRVGPYRFFFYAGDGNEPPHIHIEREDKIAKFWLMPVRLQKSGGFESSELVKLQRITEEHKQKLLRAWNDYFNT